MLVTKATQRRFSMHLAALPSCIPTQETVALFNFGLYCPLSDIRFRCLLGVISPIANEPFSLWQRIWLDSCCSRVRPNLLPGGAAMLTFLQDVRFAFRQFGNHAGFALTAILSLALGIGATVSVFSIVYAVLMNPWPYAGADRICTLSFLDKAGNQDNWSGLTGPQIRQLRQAHSLEDVMGH